MIGFRWIEHIQWLHLRHDRSTENLRLIQLIDICLSNPLLIGAVEKDCRAVLRPDIRPLPIQLGRVVGDREKDLQNLSVRNLPGIETNLDSFGTYRELTSDSEPVPAAGEHLVVTDAWVLLSRPRSNNYLFADLKRLQESRSLRFPMLDSHEIVADDKDHPVRFAMTADWQESP